MSDLDGVSHDNPLPPPEPYRGTRPIPQLLSAHLEAGDMIIDGGNEWFPNTQRRGKELAAIELVDALGQRSRLDFSRFEPNVTLAARRRATTGRAHAGSAADSADD